jgi:ankyrin repeat protein
VKWVNEKTTDDEFTPLHFASFSGNMDAITNLVANHADIHAKNKNGLTMMHMAAQSDQVNSLYYFR